MRAILLPLFFFFFASASHAAPLDAACRHYAIRFAVVDYAAAFIFAMTIDTAATAPDVIIQITRYNIACYAMLMFSIL